MNKNAKLLNSLLSVGNMPTKPTDKVPPKGKKKATKKTTKKKVTKAMPMMMNKKGKC